MPDIEGLIAEVYATAGNRLGAYGFVLTGTRADAEEFARAKSELDQASIRLQEVSITQSLKEDAPKR